MTTSGTEAIDLEVIRKRYCTGDDFQGGSICVGDINGLIATVETLRERVVELQKTTDDWIEAGKLRGERADQAEARMEAAKARVLGLEVALEFVVNMEGQDGMTDALFAEKTLALAQAALAAMPAETMERASLLKARDAASDAVIDTGQRLRSDPGSHELALANLSNVMEKLASAPDRKGEIF